MSKPNPNYVQYKAYQNCLKSWNKLYFGRVQSKISELKKLIETLQYLPQSSTIIEQEKIATSELNEIILRERILWKEKAKIKWLEEGDANTHFFHVSTITHWRYNHIPFIFEDSDDRILDIDLIGQNL